MTVPNLGWVLVEVNFKNPGLFHAHCHMMSHSMEGMGMILRVTSAKNNNIASVGQLTYRIKNCLNLGLR